MYNYSKLSIQRDADKMAPDRDFLLWVHLWHCWNRQVIFI